jgi:hypothetical protein
MMKLATWLHHVVELVGPLMRCPRHINAHLYKTIEFKDWPLGRTRGPPCNAPKLVHPLPSLLHYKDTSKSFTPLPSDEAHVWKIPLGSRQTARGRTLGQLYRAWLRRGYVAPCPCFLTLTQA